MDYRMLNKETTGFGMAKWSELNVGHKILTVISYAISLGLAVMMIMKMTGRAVLPSMHIMAALGVISICQAVVEWKRNRNSAYLWLTMAALDAIAVARDLFA